MMNAKCQNKDQIREGIHQLTVTGVSNYIASTGTQMIVIWMKNRKGLIFRQQFGLTPYALPYFIRFVSVLMNDRELRRFEPEELIGRTFIGKIEENMEGYMNLVSWRRLRKQKVSP